MVRGEQKRSSWIISWLTNLTRHHHNPANPPSAQVMEGESPHTERDHTLSSSSSSPPPSCPPSAGYGSRSPGLPASLGLTERRGSQQTTGSSVLSDGQFSSSSFHHRSSSERNVLSELWSRARQRHPHYPRFHWPHRRHRRPHSVASSGTPPRRPSQDEQVTSGHRPKSVIALPHHDKRFSLSSMFADQHTPNSLHPVSDEDVSRPVTPSLLLLNIDDNDDNNDPVQLLYSSDQHTLHRWVIRHDLVRLALDGLFCRHGLANDINQGLSDNKRVLHVGWAREVALMHPEWIVVGIENQHEDSLSNRRTQPQNFKLIRRELLDALRQFPGKTFDLVHCHFLVLSHTFDDYRELVKECWRVCRPSGYLELLEVDMRIYHSQPAVGHVTQVLNSEVVHLMESRSLDPRLARRLHDLIDADVTANYTSLPLGVWGGRIGVMFRDEVHDLIESLQPEIAKYNQDECRSYKDLEEQFERMDSELEHQRAFMNLHFCYAQKV